MTQDIRLWLYPGANPNSSADQWEPYFADISQYVRRPGNDGGQQITYSSGKQDESTQTDAGQMTLTLDNRDGRFSSDKIDGPYYGLLDTNTPIRLGVVCGRDTFTRTVASANGPAAGWAGSWLSTSSSTTTYAVDGSKGTVGISTTNTLNLAILDGAASRDVDITSTIYPLQAATGASYGSGNIVRWTDGLNYIATTLEFNTAGDVTIKIRSLVGGTYNEIGSINPIPSSSYTAGTPWKMHTQVSGANVRVKVWPAASSEPTTWTLTATETSNTGTGIGIYSARFFGNTNTGQIIGIDDFLAVGIEWTGYVVSWPLYWDITANNSWVPITAGGILRRLRQGTNPIQSPLRRQLAGTATVTGYWPMEEGESSTYFTGTVVNGPLATFSGITPAQDNTLAGGGQAPTVTSTTGSILAYVKTPNTGTGFSVMFFVKLSAIPSSKTRLARIRCPRGPVPIYDISVDATATYLEAIATDGTVMNSVSNLYAETFNGNWIAFQLETDNTSSPGNTTATSIYHAVGKAVYWAQGFTVAGTTASTATSVSLEGPNGTSFAHLWMGSNSLPFVTDSFSLVSSGYVGEKAIDRFVRVCGEAGISCSVRGGTSQTSEAMGAQRESGTMAVLQSCADTDYGVISERGSGLEFIPRAARWNLTQTMALTVSAGQIARVPNPTRDDQRLRNKWTISRTGGGTAVGQNDASVARNGTWEDSATINSQDDSVLGNHAMWRAYIGTSQKMRWPRVSINLSRSPELAAGWRSRYYGWRLGITSGLTQVRGNEPDLIVEGYTAYLDPDIWAMDLNCTDARVWAAAVADDTGIYGRADNEYCTTTALISSTALSIPITTGTVSGVNMPKWDITASLWSGGVDFNIGGERVTVTSITNGTGQAQTLNATVRGVNGYAASHPSGTSVSLWYPATVAL